MHHVSTGYPTYCREGRILEKLRHVGEYAVASTLTNVQLGIVETFQLHCWRFAPAPGCYRFLSPRGNVISYEHIDEEKAPQKW